MLAEGVDEASFSKAKDAMIKQHEINSRRNAYWNRNLVTQLRFPDTPMITGYAEALQSQNLKEFNDFLKNLYNGQNRIQVIMNGVSK